MRQNYENHGLSKTPEYISWLAMRSRCFCKTNPCYNRYGGRGITVCKRWDSFKNFYEDMGQKPSPEHTLERKNNNQNYSPKNCVWETRKVQAFNREVTLKIEGKDGRVQSAAAWEKELGFKDGIIKGRVRRGWSRERLFDPPRSLSPRTTKIITINGISKTAREWAKESHINVETLLERLRKGEQDATKLLISRYGARRNVVVEVNGISKTIGEWSLEAGINADTLYDRIFVSKWPKERFLEPVKKHGKLRPHVPPTSR